MINNPLMFVRSGPRWNFGTAPTYRLDCARINLVAVTEPDTCRRLYRRRSIREPNSSELRHDRVRESPGPPKNSSKAAALPSFLLPHRQFAVVKLLAGRSISRASARRRNLTNRARGSHKSRSCPDLAVFDALRRISRVTARRCQRYAIRPKIAACHFCPSCGPNCRLQTG
jgi:hypothetical protein